ncbi:uncharacterized protein SETTUDRAFT_102238 [Exserohilum turcica Et28A]|uniref:Azaphilone pigments biosynthesis cluster protein L N-terminal domain-containing protein n=1 Tax=Exserohilum turcicum (strain 28A) TaxID=671987 RepID=R0KP66_EXST2|nr:uncharacterized protein SETTUDRAFT_102238 [Exserohilum turcica Et28A]EOA90859.1 hypothetical protein SETTUDRAFT_102238 [Exserohilum turcica Et28A]
MYYHVLVIFAHKPCLTLHKTIQSFKTHSKRVRNLIKKLEAIIGVLESLSDTIQLHKDVDISSLNLPLRRCSRACDEFLQELQKCCSRSGGDRQSFRDWAKLRYMGDDINDFVDSLAAYKSTINIALTDIQLRKTSVTLERLGDYNDLITTATNDLEARLETIDERLQSLVERTTSSSATTELQSLEDERSSTQKCLLICAQFSKLIQQLQSSSARDLPQGLDSIPEKITSDGIRECKISMEQTTAKLEMHMQDILDRMMASSSVTMTQEDVRHLARLREEWKSTRKCRDICSQAEQHLKENVSVIDNYATGDEAVQFLVSNSQKTIHGKNRGYGDFIKQLGGHLSDQSIQKVSGDFLQMSIQRPGYGYPDDKVPEAKGIDERGTNWRPEYGGGRTLKSQPVASDSRQSS